MKALISRFSLGVVAATLVMGAFVSPIYASSVIDSTDAGNDLSFALKTTNGSGSATISAAGVAYHPGASHNICTITIQAGTVGTPTDSLRIAIRQGSNATSTILTDSFYPSTAPGSPVYPLIGTGDAGWQARSSSQTANTYTFTPCIPVVGGYWYNIYLYRDSSDTTNYYRIYGRGTGGNGTKVGTAGIVADVEFNGSNKHQFASAGMYLYINGTENLGVSTAPAPTFGSGVTDYLTSLNADNASSSLVTGGSGLNAFAGISGFIFERVPFGYLPIIDALFRNTATSSSYNFGTVHYDFSDTNISTTTRGFLPGDLTVFSTSTVTSLISPTLLAALNSVVSASLSVGWLIYAFYRIKGQIPA